MLFRRLFNPPGICHSAALCDDHYISVSSYCCLSCSVFMCVHKHVLCRRWMRVISIGQGTTLSLWCTHTYTCCIYIHTYPKVLVYHYTKQTQGFKSKADHVILYMLHSGSTHINAEEHSWLYICTHGHSPICGGHKGIHTVSSMVQGHIKSNCMWTNKQLQHPESKSKDEKKNKMKF